MDNNNLTPSFPKGEPAMDTCDWRAQLPSDSREKIIGKIMETIRKQLPYSGPEEIKELRRIASKFEERIFGCATNFLVCCTHH
ncbi:BnaC05g12040D [Brassica napus]|uniref:BnaC05g12040D protein n=2 Tax=Brassica TaxID=3705 RepID=A0A078H7B0_BRANA|nr:BnaC05g12040D [Brassica napus]